MSGLNERKCSVKLYQWDVGQGSKGLNYAARMQANYSILKCRGGAVLKNKGVGETLRTYTIYESAASLTILLGSIAAPSMARSNLSG